MPFIITEEKRQKRRAFLLECGIDPQHTPPESLEDYSQEFENLPFSLLDLYEIHLVHQLKFLKRRYNLEYLTVEQKLMIVASAIATAKLVMIGYVAKL